MKKTKAHKKRLLHWIEAVQSHAQALLQLLSDERKDDLAKSLLRVTHERDFMVALALVLHAVHELQDRWETEDF